MRHRGFFDLTWMIFRFTMKAIFVVLSTLCLFAGGVALLLSPNLGTLSAHEFLVGIASALLFGLVFVCYATLLLAVPVSAFCALAAFMITGVMRLYEHTAVEAAPLSGPLDDLEPGAIEVIGAELYAAEAACPVCAAALAGAHGTVSCMRCEAPHHSECWSYVGVCATFGCGSDRARPSTQPAPEGAPEWPKRSARWSARTTVPGKPD